MKYAVIMAGGAGTRLWPAARRDSPKQLQSLIFERPLITETVERLNAMFDLDRILIVTAERYAAGIRAALPYLPAANVIVEPVGKNTAAAIALAALRIAREDPDAVFAVLPADHVVLKPEALFGALRFAGDLAEKHRVVDIGVPPTHPETGYGYIQLGERCEQKDGLTAYRVERFVEKPDLRRAQEYLAAGTYLWNSGMFVWRAGEYLNALREHLPDTYERLKPAYQSGDWDQLARAYSEIDEISVDYAIMERTHDVVAVAVDFGWRDVGDWAALYDLMDHDADGNAQRGEHTLLDSHGSLVFAPGKMVAAVGLDNMIVVDTDDVLLIMPRDRAQEVKQVLGRLAEQGRHDLL